MKEFKNFSLGEFTSSATAAAHHIDNTPSPEVEQHIEELVETILQPLRTAWGKPLKVNSGYRSPELNKAVGGSRTSAHLCGYAADIVPTSGKIDDFIAFAEDWLIKNGIAFDQSINERSGSSKWWHIAVRHCDGRQRRQTMQLYK